MKRLKGNIWISWALAWAILFVSWFIGTLYLKPKNENVKQLRVQQNRTFTSNIRSFEQILNSGILIQEFRLRQFDPKVREVVKAKGYEMLVYSGDSLIYWTDNQISVDSCLSDIETGSSILKTRTGYYQVYKKQVNTLIYLMLFPIKKEFTYAGNDFIARDLLPDVGMDEPQVISMVSKEGFVDVRDEKGNYLFSEKIKDQDSLLPWWLDICQVLGLLFVFMSSERWMALYRKKKKPGIIFIFGISNALLLRWVMMAFEIPNSWGKLELFSPNIYAYSAWLPSMGDTCLHLLLFLRVLYLVLMAFPAPLNIEKDSRKIWIKYIWLTIVAWVLLLACLSLVRDSTIPMDISGSVLNGYTLLGITIPFLLYTGFYLVFRISSLVLPGELKVVSETWVALVLGLAGLLLGYFSTELIPLAMGLVIVFIRIQESSKDGGLLRKSFFSLITAAVFCGFTFDLFFYDKEYEIRKLTAVNLTEQTDNRAERILPDLDYRINSDPSLIRYFMSPFYSKEDLSRRLRQFYFSGYMSRYDISLFDFDTTFDNFKYSNTFSYDELDSIYRNQAIPIGESHFSRLRIPGPMQGYLGAFPVSFDSLLTGTLFILLQPRIREESNTLSNLLHQNKTEVPNRYDWAIYYKNKLFKSQGGYSYSISSGQPSFQSEFLTLNIEGHQHLIYTGEPDIQVWVSSRNQPWWKPLSLSTYFFTWFTLCMVLVLIQGFFFHLLRSIPFLFTGRVKQFWPRFYKFRRRDPFSGNVNLSLLSTRIQISIASLVLVTLVSTTLISQRSIREKYSLQQRNRLLQITKEMAVSIANTTNLKPGAYRFDELNSLAVKYSEAYRTDINLFDGIGNMLISTQPRIFETGLLSGRMDPEALRMLKFKGNSQYLQNEQIGNLSYLSAYTPIIRQEKVVAYLNLPYFTRNVDLEEEIRSTIINLLQPFSFIFVIVTFLSWLISNSFVEKLSIIRENLGRTVLGGKNAKIIWKSRDEIGDLVKQYNVMIDKLSESAEMLAKNERDSAWREMARQIAHEIKNPLTPMKLNVQQLQKAWHDKSPKLPDTMERVSRVLVEQIDALANLANSFSAFARLPESRMEKVGVNEIAGHVAQLFSGNDRLQILNILPENELYILMGRDELLRILTNLVKNAVQAIPAEKLGIVKIMVKNVNLEVVIQVSDNGEGIADNLRNKIFEPNFSTKNSGMGLGLAMVRAMTEQAGGTVGFQSELGVGTTFTLRFPSV